MNKLLIAVTVASLIFICNYYLLGYIQILARKKNYIRAGYRLRLSFIPPTVAMILATTAHFSFSELLKSWFNWVAFYRVLVIAACVWFAWSFFQIIFQSIYLRLDVTKEDNLKSRKIHTQMLFVERIIDIGIGFLGFIAVLFTFDEWYEIGRSLLTSAGILSVIIGLAAQKYLGNLISGFQIAFTQPIRIDDAVVVENEWGWIEEITLTYVVVRIWDLRRLVLPISYFTDKPFQNWTRKNAEVIGTVNLKVDFSIDVDAIRQELDRLLESTDLWNRNVKVVQVTEAHERSATIRILVSSQNSPRCWDLRCLVREHMIRFISTQPEYQSHQIWRDRQPLSL